MWREKSTQARTAFGHLSVNSDLGKDSLSRMVAVEAGAGCREMKVKEVEPVEPTCMTVSDGLAGTGAR